MDVIFTIVSRNYAALAATLMESVAQHEPAARRVVVATDGPIHSLDAIAEVVEASQLDAPFEAMCVYYDALELNTAVKPYAFRRLFAGAETVTYLDPDIRLFRPMTPVRDALAGADLVLTPHITAPLPAGHAPDDQTVLQSGAYNLGFCAMRRAPETEALAAWWAEKCRFDCRVDFEAGLFTDQRWMDLAPSFVPRTALLRHPGVNLAYWNLPARRLEQGPAGWSVEGEPLIFFHFSGFDPERPHQLSKHQDRVAVTPGSPLAVLLESQAERLAAHGHATARAIPYAHDEAGTGERLTRPMRRRALAALRQAEAEGIAAAFGAWPAPGAEAARAAYLTPAARLPAPFPRLFESILDVRPDLQPRFPLASPIGRLRFLRWLLGGGFAEHGVDPAQLPAEVLRHPQMRIAAVGLPAPAGPRARTIWVVADDSVEAPAEEDDRIFEASALRFRDRRPSAGRVERVRYRIEPEKVPAAAAALAALGVSWGCADFG